MSKKKTFGRQENILEEVDGIVAEEEAPLMEETKVEPRRISTRESMTKATTILSERGVIGEATRDTEEKESTYRGSPSLHSDKSIRRAKRHGDSGG